MPTKRIILLDYDNSVVQYALRADTPANNERFYAHSGYASIYGDALDPDLAGITSGTIVESIERLEVVPDGGESALIFRNRVQGILEQRWAAYDVGVQLRKPRQIFGRFWTGSAWSNFTG